ncbi:hypothetical protein C0J52_13411 [Blattella germanica]|nr:hypothetical protein C0J52_13411 [Blattella germanica]
MIKMEEDIPVRKLTLLKSEGSRRVDGWKRGRPEEVWNQGMEKTGVRQGRRRKVLAGARTQTGL